MSICKYCNKNLVSENAFEDGIYRILIGWLNSITCIKWYRYYPEFRRPNEQDGTTDEQYGMVFIPRYRPMLGTNTSAIDHIEVNIDGEIQTRPCITIDETEEFDLDLYVYRESGEAVRTDQTESSNQGLSSADVLKQVNILIGVNEFNRALSTADIKLNRADNIDVIVEKRESIWEWQSAATFTGTICRQVSFPIASEELIYCVETCDGQPVCIKRKCEK